MPVPNFICNAKMYICMAKMRICNAKMYILAAQMKFDTRMRYSCSYRQTIL